MKEIRDPDARDFREGRISLGYTIKRSESTFEASFVASTFDFRRRHSDASDASAAPWNDESEVPKGALTRLARAGSARAEPSLAVPMGCCLSSGKYEVEEPGAYEARRQKMLEAAEGRDAANKNRGLNPRAAQKLRAAQSAPLRDEFQSKKDQQIVNDWNS